MRLIVDYLRIRAQQGAGCNSCKWKKGYHRSHRPWPLRTIYTTKSLSLKTCHSPIPVTKKWAWKRLVPFFLVPSLCRRITDDWKNRSTWLFSVYESSDRFLCSKKKLLSFRWSIYKTEGKGFLIFWIEWREFGLHELWCDAIEVIAFHFT